MVERHPKTGRPLQRWHKLSRIDEGESALLETLKAFKDDPIGGNMPRFIDEFKANCLFELTSGVRKEHERMYDKISKAFAEFNVDQVDADDCLAFLNHNFANKLTARGHYKSRLSTFFSWCVIKKKRTGVAVNPCREVTLKRAPKREGRMNAAVYWRIHDNLSPIGQCFLTLMFLTTARPTEIRLLRESAISEEGIHFRPTKTQNSSGASVQWPMTPDIKAVIERARTMQRIKALHSGDAFLIQTAGGGAFTKSGMNSLWRRACKKASLQGVTTRDVRPYALTVAEEAGHRLEDLRKAAAHTTVTTTEGYLNQYREVVSPVRMTLPKREKT